MERDASSSGGTRSCSASRFCRDAGAEPRNDARWPDPDRARVELLIARHLIGAIWLCSLLDDPASQRSRFSKRCICALFASTCYLRLHHGEGSKISAFFSPSPPPCKAGSLCGHDHDPPSLTQEASGGCSFIFWQLSARYMEHLLCAMT